MHIAIYSYSINEAGMSQWLAIPQKVWISYSYVGSYFVKRKNEMRAPAALQKLTISYLDFDLSKVRFRAHSHI